VASVALITFFGVGGLSLLRRLASSIQDFTPRRVRETRWARYEKEFKQYETLPQPKITAVEVAVDIVPERATITATGIYTLVNKDVMSISTVHVLDNERTLKALSFDRPYKEVQFDKELRYHIYRFESPLMPGETAHMRFTSRHENLGFQDTGTAIVANGSFSGAEGLPKSATSATLNLKAKTRAESRGCRNEKIWLRRIVPESARAACFRRMRTGYRSRLR
jgi:hypothetical protein